MNSHISTVMTLVLNFVQCFIQSQVLKILHTLKILKPHIHKLLLIF